ncbi:hypothetical protein K8353_47690 [Burkholderia contaminans]|nr:hypothetical protein [Burkholderia contaminans]
MSHRISPDGTYKGRTIIEK